MKMLTYLEFLSHFRWLLHTADRRVLKSSWAEGTGVLSDSHLLEQCQCKHKPGQNNSQLDGD